MILISVFVAEIVTRFPMHEFALFGSRAGLPTCEWIEHSPNFVSGLIASKSAELVV